MEIKKISKKVNVYQVTKSFFVEVQEDELNNQKMLHFYLYHNYYCIKHLMFGVCKHCMKEEKLTIEEIIKNNFANYLFDYYKYYIIPNLVDEELLENNLYEELNS